MKFKNIVATDYCNKVADGTHDSPKRQDKGKFLITSRHIKGRSIDFENAYLISEEDFNQINQRSKVDQWDILISMIGEYCGFSYVERNEIVDYAVKNVGIFKTGDKIKAEWLYYYLISPNGKNTLLTLRSGTSQPYIPLGALRALEIPVPEDESKMEQIVFTLSSLDDKIELNLQMNQTLEAMAQAIFKEWFVNFNFPSFDGVLQNGLPKGWRMGKVGEEFNLTMGQSPPGETYNENGDGMIFYQGRTDFGFRFPENRMFTTSPTRIAEKLDTLVSVRAPVGDINMAIEKCCVGRGLSAIRHKSGAYSYTFYAMKSIQPIFRGYEGEGTVFGSINKGNFENIEIVAPAKNVISEFETVVNAIDDKIFNNAQEIKTLTQVRDSLLPKLMTGKIEIKA